MQIKKSLRKSLTMIVAAQCMTIAMLSGIAVVSAQQLPIRKYSVAEGLPATWLADVYQDSKGYIWAVSGMTVSRFDGYRFLTYDARNELGESVYFSDIAEDREGRLWFATFGWAGVWGKGVARLIDDPGDADSLRRRGMTATPQSSFVVYPVGDAPAINDVSRLLFDSTGTLWCVTDAGLYRAQASSNDSLDFEMVISSGKVDYAAAFADSRGRLWFGLNDNLIEIASGSILTYGLPDEGGHVEIAAVAEDSHGRLVAANRGGLFEFIEPAASNQRGSWKELPLAFLPKQELTSLVFDSADTLWIGTQRGLIKYREGRQFLYTTAQGLGANIVSSLCMDKEGDLWMGTSGSGLSKLSGEMIVSYTEAEGLPDKYIGSTIQDNQGRIYAMTGLGGIAEIKEDKAVLIPGSEAHLFSSVVQDRMGDWWVGTPTGLFRFKGQKLQFRRGKKLTQADGIPEAPVRTIYEDSSGQIWVSLEPEHLYRFDPGAQGRPVSEREQLAASGLTTGIIKMLDDGSGTVWLGSHSQLGRWANGKITVFEPAEGLPETRPRALFKDSRGWLWIGLRNRGLSISKDPDAKHPTFINYSTKNGLSNDSVWSIVEDDDGRIYFATENGINQLDPSNGQIRHISTKDGLAGDSVTDLLKDKDGNIWASTNGGVSRYNPGAERKGKRPPQIYLDRIAAAGEEIPLARGATSFPQMTLGPSQNSLRIEFVGLSFYGEASLKYQYKLEGIDKDWSTPSEERSVNYPQLTSGTYRLLMRAISRDGLASPEPAVLSFRVLPPIWQRWWFVSLALIGVALAAYALYRYRVARLLELERVKLRIAADLHDEMGSGLGSIGILSGLAADDDLDEAERKQLARKIAVTSGELGTALGEIVWALRPGSATLESFAYHIAERAGRLFPGRGTSFNTDFPIVWPGVTLSLATWRNLLLIASEALHNAARHAEASKVVFGMSPAGKRCRMWIADDGVGLPEDGALDNHQGLGLASMRRRAKEVGAEISWSANGGTGTTVVVLFDPHAEDQSIQGKRKKEKGKSGNGKPE